MSCSYLVDTEPGIYPENRIQHLLCTGIGVTMYPTRLSGVLLAFSSLCTGVARAASSAKYSFNELWDLQNDLWKNFLYPSNLKQINATDESVFTADVSDYVLRMLFAC